MPCDELNLIKFIQWDWMNKQSHSDEANVYVCSYVEYYCYYDRVI